MKLTVKKLVILSLLVALSVILSIVDSLIPSFIPGMKLGLANIVILFTLYVYGWKEAVFIDLLRVLLGSFLRGTFLSMGFYMSLSGAALSLIVMICLKLLFKKIHIVGISVLGSLFHSLGQIIIGMIFLSTSQVIYYLPVLALTSVGTGIFVALCSKYLLKLNLIKDGKTNVENE